MDIEFASRRLARCAESLAEATREFGVPIGRKYLQRLAIIRAVDAIGDLFGHRALRFHPLKGDREGQFAMILTANYRLILEKAGNRTVRVMSVEDYHGE